MREILLILSMLILGVFTARAFGYTPTSADVVLIDSFQDKIEQVQITNPSKINRIYTKLWNIIPEIESSTRAHYVLSELFFFMQDKYFSVSQEYSTALVNLLAQHLQE